MCLRLVVPSLLTEPKLLPLFYNVISFKLDVPASNYVFHYFHYQFERAFLLFLILLPFSRMSVRSKLSDPDSEPKNYITHSSHMYTISQKINCTEIVKKKRKWCCIKCWKCPRHPAMHPFAVLDVWWNLVKSFWSDRKPLNISDTVDFLAQDNGEKCP